MLTHKLADYYHLTHQFDPLAGSVRIFRTPFCRLPESLSSVSNPPTTGNTPPPVPTMKILRRGGDNGSPSKTTSENGKEGEDKSKAAKERMSREEKEAHYHAARERIFGQADKSGDQTPGKAHLQPHHNRILTMIKTQKMATACPAQALSPAKPNHRRTAANSTATTRSLSMLDPLTNPYIQPSLSSSLHGSLPQCCSSSFLV